MRLDRAGGGAASGEGERLPGMIFFVLFLLQKKENTNRDSESCRRQTAARKNDEGQ